MNNQDVQSKIKRNYIRFEGMVSRAVQCQDDTRQIFLCSQAAFFAVHNPCGVLASPDIESCLVNIASRHSVSLSESFQDGHILHVFTRAFPIGGHTQVCERWIDSLSKDYVQSVVCLNQGAISIPDFLRQAVLKTGGVVEEVVGKSPLDLALGLRRLAARYHFIILHTHMYDVVPLLAFGTHEFSRPVLKFNHADHLFWLGGMVIDLLLNFRTMSVDHNAAWRGIDRNALVPLPTGELVFKVRDLHKSAETRRHLGFVPENKVIVTIGSSYKFKPFAGLDFIATIRKIMTQNDRAVFLIIGPSAKEKEWASIIKDFPRRVQVIGTVPYHEIDGYVQIADLALEPFPLGSPTALIDAVQYQIPCVSLYTPVNNYDAFLKSGILCDTQEEVVERVSAYLVNPPKDNKFVDILRTESAPDAIRVTIKGVFSKLSFPHKIYDIPIDYHRDLSDFEIFVAQQIFVCSGALPERFKRIIRLGVYWMVCHLPIRFIQIFYPVARRYFLM
jgi:hypothetical protein